MPDNKSPDSAEGPSTPHPIQHLDPDSYTANRLLHATPEHLHLTSRRCFVGPIPEGWLKSHRRDWYRQHLGLNYSSRSVRFEANDNVGPHRSVTGLDGPSLSIAHQHNFPQPQDLDDQSEGDNDDEGGDDESQHSDTVRETTRASAKSSGVSPPNENDFLSPELESDEERKTDQTPTSKHTHTHAQALVNTFKKRAPLSTQHSFALSRKPRSSRQPSSVGSFVTASETLSSEPPGQPSPVNKPLSEITDNSSGAHLSGGRPSDADKSNRGSWAPRLKDPPSTESLLSHGKTMNGGSPSTTNDGGASAEHEQDLASKLKDWREQNEGIGQSKSDTEASRLVHQDYAQRRARTKSVGLVRFNMPLDDENDDVAARNVRMRVRLEQSRRRDTIKRVGKEKLQNGTIVKMEKMLVRIEYTSHDLDKDYDENESSKIEARPLEKWHEFMVVCREGEDKDAKFYLQFYKTRVIPALDDARVSKRSAHEIPLNQKSTHINIYSSLDKTIVMWLPYRKGTKIFILKTRAGANAMEWFTFIRNALGWRRQHVLLVNVPDLGVCLRLKNPFEELLASQNAIDAADGDEEALQRAMQDEHAICGRIVQQCIHILEKSPEWRDVVSNWSTPALHQMDTAFHKIYNKGTDADEYRETGEAVDSSPKDSRRSAYEARSVVHDPVGLAWKRYDRLEWVHGANEKKMYGTIGMAKSHELELRPKQHYATSVPDAQGKDLEEPPPVEGFLIRLTSQRGADQKLGKLFFKRLYFSTHNQFLVFCRPAHADPPPPPDLSTVSGARVPDSHEINQKIPLIYAVNPYPLKNSWVTWLTSEEDKSADKIAKHDRQAYDENERNIKLLLNCDGVINLCNIVSIRSANKGAVRADTNLDDGEEVDFDQSVPDSFRDDGVTREPDLERTFELLMRNGLVIRLQAFNETAKSEWMKRLKDLLAYWSRRVAADMALYRSIRKQNLDQLNIDEELEAVVGQFSNKWEVGRSFASPELYNMCGISCCRTIHMAGMLYHKSGLRASVKQSLVLLTHGRLIFFKDALRSRSGRILAHTYHPRAASLDLQDCYIYSGLVTDNDLLYTNRHFDKKHPGHHALPRMYREDKWSSIDEDVMTCFVVWHGNKKSWFRSEEPDGKAKKKQTIKQVSKLGAEGKRIVFKTRSRAERDHWVMNIAMEIERMAQNDDFRLVKTDQHN